MWHKREEPNDPGQVCIPPPMMTCSNLVRPKKQACSPVSCATKRSFLQKPNSSRALAGLRSTMRWATTKSTWSRTIHLECQELKQNALVVVRIWDISLMMVNHVYYVIFMLGVKLNMDLVQYQECTWPCMVENQGILINTLIKPGFFSILRVYRRILWHNVPITII